MSQPEAQKQPHGHALYSAVYNGHYEIARLLLEHGAYPNPEVESSHLGPSIARRARLAAAEGDTGSARRSPERRDGG